MKILKIFGAVVSIHLAALFVIFAVPGCSSSTKPPPAPADTVVKAEPPNGSTSAAAPAPVSAPAPLVAAAPRSEPVPATPILFDPSAPALPAATGSSTIRFNPTRPNTPVASTLVAEPVKDVVPTATYVVKSGDSLWTIAKKNKVTVADLTAANGIAANANLQPGQKLLVPGKSGAAPAPSSPAPGGNGAAAASSAKAAKSEPAAAPRAGGATTKHTVRTGESLTTIARDYGVRQRDIAVANNITDPGKIRAGHELVIPLPAGKSAPAGKASAVEAPAISVPSSSPPSVPIIRLDEPTVVPAPKP